AASSLSGSKHPMRTGPAIASISWRTSGATRFVKAECRNREALDDGDHVRCAACHARVGIERLEAGQGVEDIDSVIKKVERCRAVLFTDALHDDLKALTPALVTRSNTLFEISVQCRERPESSKHDAFGCCASPKWHLAKAVDVGVMAG